MKKMEKGKNKKTRARRPWNLCLWAAWILAAAAPTTVFAAEEIPLPEHPRPDFQRPEWTNLNGTWQFRFDPDDAGAGENWQDNTESFDRSILVPFPWGSPLSGVPDEGDIGWYARTIRVPKVWFGKRVFLVIGACDWETTVWVDGEKLGTHQGGYTPFDFDLTPHAKLGEDQEIVIRVDDVRRQFTLYGKQGYGQARGIWQTPYLEARGQVCFDSLQFLPDIDAEKVTVRARLAKAASEPVQLNLEFKTGGLKNPKAAATIEAGKDEIEFDFPIPNPRLWDLDDPFLYEVNATLTNGGGASDQVATYFGMREIGVERLPGSDIPYIALNGKPIYLQMALDQAYHPEGFYTFPTDAFMRDEILRSRRIGLNGMRIHVKIGIPRKLYWADRLGMLIMEDVPNSWGEPDADMRSETEAALRGMIRRDFNHPSIFSWVVFNETWGLRTKVSGGASKYLPETQEWVAEMYRLAKSLDPTRLVEDNSPNKKDHVETDINSWHAYLPGYQWEEQLAEYSEQTFPGSEWNFVEGRKQGGQPQFNSECGNVWGYKGSTGDVDWSWDYHRMINAFRRHPKTCGWLYTEHHDVVNEWNGYFRFDRSEKFTGLSDLVEGMSILDLHGPYYLSPAGDLSQEVEVGAIVKVPLWASVTCDFGKPVRKARIRGTLRGWDTLGRKRMWGRVVENVELKPWMSEEIATLEVQMPEFPGLAVLAIYLEDLTGKVLHRNCVMYVIDGKAEGKPEVPGFGGRTARLVRIDPKSFSNAEWSLKQWNVLDGLKVNGAGSGFFEYRVPWPEGVELDAVEDVSLVLEVSAKQLFGKDRDESTKIEGNFMLGKGTHDPSRNANSYPMTDTVLFPSIVRVRVSGQTAGVANLPDDPADHRGVLSWHSQLRDKVLREAGSYGYLVQATIPPAALEKAAADKEIVIRLEVDSALPGGLAIYGKRFGRYPLDPTLVFRLKGGRAK